MVDQGARSIVQNALQEWDLGALGEWAWSRYLEHNSIDVLRLEIQDRQEYKDRFAGKIALAKFGRSISEAEQIAYEKDAAAMMRQAGMPAGFYDSWTDFQGLIGTDTSIAEVGRRINDAYARVAVAPPEVRRTMGEFYGAEADAALAALVLDKDLALPVIMNRIAAAELGGELSRQGIKIGQSLAERAARTASTTEQIRQAAQQLGALNESGLFNERFGESDITLEQGVEAVVEGQQGYTNDLQRRIAQRRADLSGSGGFSKTQTGVTGIGAAPRT